MQFKKIEAMSSAKEAAIRINHTVIVLIIQNIQKFLPVYLSFIIVSIQPS